MVKTNSFFTTVCAEHNVIEGLCVAHIKITLNGERYCATRRLSPTGLPPRGASHRTAPDGLCGVTCDMGRVACLRQACVLVAPMGRLGF